MIRKCFNLGEYKTINDFENIKGVFFKKEGIEIGGPSTIFKKGRFIPIYPLIKRLDGVNFKKNTIWSNPNININEDFYIDNKTKVGKLYISDATDLQIIQNKKYDFVLSSNNIEHIANPMKALEKWLFILKNKGVLLIVAPKKESNFDNKRNIVSFEHIMDDYKKNIEEDDLNHLDEIMKNHDYKMDLGTKNIEEFKKRGLNNFENRCLHQHVFDLGILKKIYQHFNLSILITADTGEDYVIIGQKII